MKPILRILRIGNLPAEAQHLGAPNPPLLADEQLTASITFRGFRSPRHYSSWRRQWFVGSLAIAHDRLLAYRFSRRLINLPFADQRFSEVWFRSTDSGALEILHDASLFHPLWSGEIQYRFNVPDASLYLSKIRTLASGNLMI